MTANVSEIRKKRRRERMYLNKVIKLGIVDNVTQRLTHKAFHNIHPMELGVNENSCTLMYLFILMRNFLNLRLNKYERQNCF